MPGKSWEKPRAEVPKAAKAPWEMIPGIGEGVSRVASREYQEKGVGEDLP